MTDANVGTDTFWLSISYDQPMDTGRYPTITMVGELPGDAGVSSTLRYDDAQSWWINSQLFRAKYNVIDNDIYIPHVDVSVTGVLDAIGNLQNPATLTDLFSINTKVQPITVTMVQPQAYVGGAWIAATQITDANVGADMFRINVYYSAATVMNTPTISYSPDISSTLTLDPGWSFWVSPTEYRATYNVADADVVVNPITINVSRARDTSGYEQARYIATAPFSINTTTGLLAAPLDGAADRRGAQQRDAESAHRDLDDAHGPTVRYQPGRSGPGLDRDVVGGLSSPSPSWHVPGDCRRLGKLPCFRQDLLDVAVCLGNLAGRVPWLGGGPAQPRPAATSSTGKSAKP